MKTRTIWFATAILLSSVAAFGVPYDPAVHGDPIVFDSAEPVVIDGGGAVIDGQHETRCATVGANVTLTNFVFRNGFADFGGGVCGGALLGCRIENCTADLGGGAYGSALTNCTVVGCAANESGAALGDCTAYGCALTGNERPVSSSLTAVRGGVVFGSALTRCTLSGNVVGLGAQAPAFGGIGADVTLKRCTVGDDNVVTAADGVFYGRAFAYSTIDGRNVEFSDSADAGDPEPVEPFDGSVARNYVATLEDGSVLTVSTAKESRKKGVSSVSVTAKLTKGGVDYAYAGGAIDEGLYVTLPTSKTYGAPKFSSLVFSETSVEGVLGGEWLLATAVTQELFGGAFELSPREGRVGVVFAGRVTVDPSWGPVKYAASKLPGGLKLNAKTGEVTGVPTKAGSFATAVTVTSTLDAKCKGTMQFPFAVAALDEWIVGKFVGGSEKDPTGSAEVSVGKTGKVSGKWKSGGQTWTLKASGLDGYDGEKGAYAASVEAKSGKASETVEVRFVAADVAAGERHAAGTVGVAESGLFGAAYVNWKALPWSRLAQEIRNEKFVVTDGAATLSCKVGSGGAVTAAGEFDVGASRPYKASVKAALVPVGEDLFDLFVCYPPKESKGFAGYAKTLRLRWAGQFVRE